MSAEVIELKLMDLPVHDVTVPQLHEYITKCIQSRQKARILNLNIRGANFAIKLPWFKKAIQEAELVFCDGDGVRWGLSLLNQKAPVKITYDRWVWQLAEYCEQKGHSLYFLGSKPGIAEKAKHDITKKHPKVRILGAKHGYFDKEGVENQEIINEINKAKPDILMIGFGMPIQERWIQENWQKIDSTIFLAGGAALECVSGHLNKPPKWVVRWQLEWLYRWAQQPLNRFERYAVGIPYFFFHVFKYKICKR